MASSAAAAFDPALEAMNFAKVTERQLYVTGTPAFQARLQQQNVEDASACSSRSSSTIPTGCPPTSARTGRTSAPCDVRFYDWEENGFGVSTPVLFTARNGANISGMVWATLAGPPSARRS